MRKRRRLVEAEKWLKVSSKLNIQACPPLWDL